MPSEGDRRAGRLTVPPTQRQRGNQKEQRAPITRVAFERFLEQRDRAIDTAYEEFGKPAKKEPDAVPPGPGSSRMARPMAGSVS
jgi:hypothetical protein